ncbi:MAG: hypothetical protein R3E83_15455 [Burkholderiaceae bacterium]
MIEHEKCQALAGRHATQQTDRVREDHLIAKRECEEQGGDIRRTGEGSSQGTTRKRADNGGRRTDKVYGRSARCDIREAENISRLVNTEDLASPIVEIGIAVEPARANHVQALDVVTAPIDMIATGKLPLIAFQLCEEAFIVAGNRNVVAESVYQTALVAVHFPAYGDPDR